MIFDEKEVVDWIVKAALGAAALGVRRVAKDINAFFKKLRRHEALLRRLYFDRYGVDPFPEDGAIESLGSGSSSAPAGKNGQSSSPAVAVSLSTRPGPGEPPPP